MTVGAGCYFTYDVGHRVLDGDRDRRARGLGQCSFVVDGNHRFRDLSKPFAEQGYDYRTIEIADDDHGDQVHDRREHRQRAVIGANAVVSRPIPAYCVAAGVPARVLDYFGPPERRRPNGSSAGGQGDGRPAGPAGAPGGLGAFDGLRRRRHGLREPLHRQACGAARRAGGERRGVRRDRLLARRRLERSGTAGTRPCSSASIGRRTVEAEPPMPALALTYYGVSGLALLGPRDLGPFEHALRTVISRHRAAAVFEEEPRERDLLGRVRAPGAADGPDCSGDGVMETATTGATLTVDVPDAFPGGTIALGFVASPDAGAPARLRGGRRRAGGGLDTRTAAEPLGHRTGIVARLRDLAPGAHTIACAVSETSGPVAFDYWQVEADPGPTVLVPLAFRMRDWSHHYSDWPHQPGDARPAGAERRDPAGGRGVRRRCRRGRSWSRCWTGARSCSPGRGSIPTTRGTD